MEIFGVDENSWSLEFNKTDSSRCGQQGLFLIFLGISRMGSKRNLRIIICVINETNL